MHRPQQRSNPFWRHPPGPEVIHNPGEMSPVAGLSVMCSKLKNADSTFYDRSQQNLKGYEYINLNQ